MSALRLLIFVWLVLNAWTLAQAQQESPAPQASVEPGAAVSDTLDAQVPRRLYWVEGSRGEVIRFHLRSASGDLDPVLTVFDESGTILFSRDDMAGSRDVEVTLTMPRTTRYYIVVGRFGYSQGSTSGRFEMRLERVGVISEQGTNLLYDIPIIDTISSTQPQRYYTFRAQAGKIIHIEMLRTSGTLDPYLQVVDRSRFVIAENDDAPGSGTRNARIENLMITETGTYIVIATRYGLAAGESVGSFVLMISEAANSGLANSSQTAVPLAYNQTYEDAVNDEQIVRYYVFDARRDDLVTITQNQIAGQLDALVTLANAGLQPLISDDDSGGGRNARIERYRIPADGRYYIIAGRAGGEAGTSAGQYRLQLIYEGSAFDGVDEAIPRLDFGSTTQGSISQENTAALFAFYGQQGEQITIAMYRADGNLDPVVQLLDRSLALLASDDDSAGSQNARIQYRLPQTGLYYIRATRYQGSEGASDTTGGYNLILSRMLE